MRVGDVTLAHALYRRAMGVEREEAADLWRRRAAANRLSPRCRGGVADVVRAVCGLQAQDPAAARLSVRARSEGLTAADVDASQDIVRVWAWRGTLHLLAREDVPWVLSLVAPAANRGVAARWRQLGLDEATYARAREVIRERLPATRADLRAALAAAAIDASGQRLPHLVRRAALDGLLHHPLDGTFAPLSLPDPPPRERALAELSRRYGQAYGPATVTDLAAFAGVPAADARAAWAAGPGDAGPATDAAPRGGTVRLLPAFDTYLLGHRQRPVAPEHERRVWPGGGWIHPVVLVDGMAAGTWRLPDGAVEVEPFGAAIPEEPLAEEIADVKRFLGA
jgi:hypothetical protein